MKQDQTIPVFAENPSDEKTLSDLWLQDWDRVEDQNLELFHQRFHKRPSGKKNMLIEAIHVDDMPFFELEHVLPMMGH